MTTRLLTVTRCIDCPFHKELSDPGSDDSFDMMDTSIVCTKAKKQTSRADRWNPDGYRMVSCSERPWRHKSVEIPEWCPLPMVATKAKD